MSLSTHLIQAYEYEGINSTLTYLEIDAYLTEVL